MSSQRLGYPWQRRQTARGHMQRVRRALACARRDLQRLARVLGGSIPFAIPQTRQVVLAGEQIPKVDLIRVHLTMPFRARLRGATCRAASGQVAIVDVQVPRCEESLDGGQTWQERTSGNVYPPPPPELSMATTEWPSALQRIVPKWTRVDVTLRALGPAARQVAWYLHVEDVDT